MKRILLPVSDLRDHPRLKATLKHKYSISLSVFILAHILIVAFENNTTVLLAPLILLSLYLIGFLLMGVRSRFCRIILASGILALALSAAHIVYNGTGLLITTLCFHAAFLALLIVFILGRLFKDRQMPLDNIMAGVIVFLLMAGLWAQFYALAVLINPLALSAPGGTLGTHPYVTLYYFSITTLTTAGLGDVTPVTDMARILAAYEALVGQVYLVVFIALLMGRHFANR